MTKKDYFSFCAEGSAIINIIIGLILMFLFVALSLFINYLLEYKLISNKMSQWYALIVFIAGYLLSWRIMHLAFIDEHVKK